MTTSPRFVLPYQTVIDAAGVPIPHAELNFYLTGTSTRADTYSNTGLSIANTNPVVALANGQFENIFLDPAVIYKVVLTTSSDPGPPDEIWTADPVQQSWFQTPDTFFDLPFEFLGSPPEADEILGMVIFNRPSTIPGNFNGAPLDIGSAHGYCVTAPADGNYVADVLQNDVSVGTMTIVGTTGVFVFSTPGGVDIDIDTGDVLKFVGQTDPDSQLAGLTWSIVGYLPS